MVIDDDDRLWYYDNSNNKLWSQTSHPFRKLLQTDQQIDRPTNNINKTICLERLLERVLAGVVQGTPAQVVAQPGYKKSWIIMRGFQEARLQSLHYLYEFMRRIDR